MDPLLKEAFRLLNDANPDPEFLNDSECEKWVDDCNAWADEVIESAKAGKAVAGSLGSVLTDLRDQLSKNYWYISYNNVPPETICECCGERADKHTSSTCPIQ